MPYQSIPVHSYAMPIWTVLAGYSYNGSLNYEAIRIYKLSLCLFIHFNDFLSHCQSFNVILFIISHDTSLNRTPIFVNLAIILLVSNTPSHLLQVTGVIMLSIDK